MAEDFMVAYERRWAELEANDKSAKTAGLLVGRYISHPYADGAAIYRITKVAKTRVTIEHVAVGDAWVLPAWGHKATIALALAENMVGGRDKMAELFAKRED